MYWLPTRMKRQWEQHKTSSQSSSKSNYRYIQHCLKIHLVLSSHSCILRKLNSFALFINLWTVQTNAEEKEECYCFFLRTTSPVHFCHRCLFSIISSSMYQTTTTTTIMVCGFPCLHVGTAPDAANLGTYLSKHCFKSVQWVVKLTDLDFPCVHFLVASWPSAPYFYCYH